MKLTVGILAGRRAGGVNDAKLKACNRAAIKRLTEEFKPLGEVIISASQRSDYTDLSERVFQDGSPIEGLYNVVKFSDGDYVFVCGADMPKVSRELALYMSQFISSDYDCFCLTDEKHIQPLCAIYAKSALPAIEAAVRDGDYKLINLLKRIRTKYINLKYTCFDGCVTRNMITRQPEEDLKPRVVFCVSGAKNTGKTGLIIRLINEFIREGYSVGTIKHDGHEYEADREGADTYKFYEAGAEMTAIFSKTQFSVNRRRPVTEEDLAEYCLGIDVVIIEGLKNSSYPKVETVLESGKGLCAPHTLICQAAEIISPCQSGFPVFDRNDTEGIFSCVKKYFKLERLV